MSFLVALLMLPSPGLEASADEQTHECPGPPFGFEAHTERFNAGTEQGMAQIADLMNSSLWRHGWFEVLSNVPDTDDRAAVQLVQRRQARLRRELARRGIASSRLRFAPITATRAEGDDENAFAIVLVVPERIWREMVDPRMMC